jgi:hypothetical protein
MTWSPWRDASVRVAAVFAAAASIIALTAVVAAFRPVHVAAAPTLALSALADTASSPRPSSATFAFAEPFSPLRGAVGDDSAAPPELPPAIALIGTVIGGEQPAAICRLGAAAPRILHAGDTLGGWRLVEIAPARAVFIDAARVRHELRLSPPGN